MIALREHCPACGRLHFPRRTVHLPRRQIPLSPKGETALIDLLSFGAHRREDEIHFTNPAHPRAHHVNAVAAAARRGLVIVERAGRQPFARLTDAGGAYAEALLAQLRRPGG